VSERSYRLVREALQDRVFASRASLADAFRSADPFPHVVIDDFLRPELCDQLLAEFPPFERGCALNEHGRPGGKAVVEDVRAIGGAFTRVDDLIRDPDFLQVIGDITGMKDLLYDSGYIGGGTHENRATQDLDPHIDFNFHPRHGWHRRLNLILYLNPEWDESWGGALELHTDPWRPAPHNRIVTVLPVKNRCVIFETSERSWHGFRRITPPADPADLSRRSFAIYLYSEERPPSEIAAPHATVYVQRPLPASLQAGTAIAEDDVKEISSLLSRRTQQIDLLVRREARFVSTIDEQLQLVQAAQNNDALTAAQVDTLRWLAARQDEHLRYLYDREKQFTERIQDLDRLSRATLPLGGGLELVSDVTGYWGDQWAGANLRFRVRAPHACTAVNICGHVPPAMALGQDLVLAIGDRTWTRHNVAGDFEWSVPVKIDAGSERQVRVSASREWEPSAAGSSEDARRLAWHVRAIEAV
jgi:hypothetical protein